MKPDFKKTLETNKRENERPLADHCQLCYRRNLKPEQIAFVSHGEIYCKPCAKVGGTI